MADMTYGDYEESPDSGAPVKCYLFRRGGLVYAYTTADREITINNIDFKPGSQVSDGGYEASGDTSASGLEVTINAGSEVSKLYKAYAPSSPLSLTVWEQHVDPDQPIQQYIVSWMGHVSSVKWTDQITCVLNCTTLMASTGAPGLRRCWQKPCSNTLYDADCKVSPEMFKDDDVILEHTGETVTLTTLSLSYPANRFAGGYISWFTQDGVEEQRGIRQSAGRVLTILGNTRGMYNGAQVRVYPGCNHTITVCSGTFGNEANYGGTPHLPGRSPFDGNPVF